MTHDQILAGYWALFIFVLGVSLLAVSKRMERNANLRRIRYAQRLAKAVEFEAAWEDIVARLEAQDDEPTVELCGLVEDEYLPSLAEQAIEIPREGETHA